MIKINLQISKIFSIFVSLIKKQNKMSNKNESKDCLINKLNTLQENFEKDTKALREQINAIDKCPSLTYKDIINIDVAEDILKDVCGGHIKFTENQFCRKIDWIGYKLETMIKAVNFLDNGGKIWIKNWDNSSEYYYTPYFDMRNGSFVYNSYHGWPATSFVRFGSGFKNKETMLHCVNVWLQDYKFYHTGK